MNICKHMFVYEDDFSEVDTSLTDVMDDETEEDEDGGLDAGDDGGDE